MRKIDQSTAYNLTVFMADSSDHVTGKTGLTLTITASKNGAAYGSISPTVTELSYGNYSLALTSSHTDTLGDLAIHCSSTGADPTDVFTQIKVAPFAGGAVASVTGNVGGSVASVTAGVTLAASQHVIVDSGTVTTLTNLPSIPANWITSSGINASALNGKGDWNIGKTGYTLTQSFPANFASLSITAGGVTSCNVTSVNGHAVTGDGHTGTEWGPA